MLPKNPKFNLKLKFQRIFEISLILSIILLIGAFRFFPNLKHKGLQVEPPQDVFIVDDVIRTNEDLKPPTPPKPPIPIEAPIDDELEDIPIENTEIDFDAKLDKPKQLFNDNESVEFDIYVPIADILPEPIGGIQGIQKRIVYPELAIKAGIQGKVFIKAFVDEFGNVKKTELVKGIGVGCDEAAIDAVLATKFKPGLQRQRPVKVQVVIPILFKLN